MLTISAIYHAIFERLLPLLLCGCYLVFGPTECDYQKSDVCLHLNFLTNFLWLSTMEKTSKSSLFLQKQESVNN